MTKVFWLEGTALERHTLRRYASTLEHEDGAPAGHRGGPCPTAIARGASPEWASHDVSAPLYDAVPARDGQWEGFGTGESEIGRTDPRWPTHCSCGHAFHADDHWQHNGQRLYAGAPDGQLYTLRDAPIGAMWNAHWMSGFVRGAGGICLCVRTPGGDWMVDDQSSNCTRPDDRVHKCWVRHGDPRTGELHVDKDGDTCAAGAGSILTGGFHGFLQHGHLTPC